MKKAAVILAGCGARDGSEIQEATMALYALDYNGVEVQAFSKDAPQTEVVNHLTMEVQPQEQRGQIEESARIVRGSVLPLSELNVDDFDCLVIPGGTGLAKNLFTFAFDGLDFTVDALFTDVVKSFHSAGKPIAAMCIAPLAVASILSESTPIVTLGAEGELSEAVAQKLGVVVLGCDPEGVVVDADNKIVTTPSYMYGDSSIKSIGAGALALVDALLEL